ncbi:hypothetical protein NV381_05135 [Paenibacillus sp. N5-1-1-5]|uniref:HTH araC/xylS-type domain-containing protein n=1 Tax=Paenibacillus radicis (ex Xue et al. 2023) TaxID=2972489 RepID=A0ABT1YED5_9BACL|nr:hypothetical protein [Paenibacillus radicis (ex Xue et al. 2023)]MCR8630583.1 hypothetical protein [Paenibacillus radicis (ex Xue et al. 2023)]
MNERYREDLSLDECAQAAATNPYTLSRGFKQVTGFNFVDYLTHVTKGLVKKGSNIRYKAS